jgi:solute carrier family 39 (zinc transporter), member 1/2/3
VPLLDDEILIKVVPVLIVVAIALAAGWAPLHRRAGDDHVEGYARGEALAVGVFLGAGIIHMLGDTASDFVEAGITYPVGEVLCGAVILLLLWLEHLGNRLAGAHGANERTVLAILASLILAFHSFLVGAALGTASELSTTIVVLVAVLAHKWAAAFALSLTLSRSQLSSRNATALFLTFVLMFPAGVAVGAGALALTASHPLFEPTFAGLAAGTFIYLGTLHGLTSSTLIAKCQHFPQFAMVALGFLLMAVVAIWT